jgi:hypothetical protein
MWQAPGKLLGKGALKKSYQRELISGMHASPSSRSCGVCGRDKEKIMRKKSDKKRFQWKAAGGAVDSNAAHR